MLSPPIERCPASQERKDKAPGAASFGLPKEASIREPQADERREAPGTDHHQWREGAL